MNYFVPWSYFWLVIPAFVLRSPFKIVVIVSKGISDTTTQQQFSGGKKTEHK